MTTSKTAAELTAEEEAREDIRYYTAEIAYMETHDLSEELAAAPKCISRSARACAAGGMLWMPNFLKRWQISPAGAASPPRPC